MRGQEHVTRALRNAVDGSRVAHAYLFSGPRGTGKTSTARILAKALNCAAPVAGEPCGECASCREVAAGSSLDVHELDAASNNGVEAMRDLVARAALGTPGRWKVYIVDEVHMLSTAASNALLKTLEEPPAHVVFVLATTDPQKVLPTVRSRTQHFEFHLLGPHLLAALVEDVRDDAGLDLAPESLEVAVRRARGSARDALSVLDQVAAAGAALDELPVLDDLVEAICERDTGRALVAVAEATAAGRGADRIAAELVERLRQGFLAVMAPETVSLAPAEGERVASQARRLGLAALVRSMEVIGRAQVEMRDSLDPRLGLEVALVRITHPEVDDSPAAVVERLERLEHRVDERDPLVRDFESHGPPAPGGAPPSPTPGRPGGESSGQGQPEAPRGAGSAGSRSTGPGRRAPRNPGGPGPSAREAGPPPTSTAGSSGPAAEARAALGAIRARAEGRGAARGGELLQEGSPPADSGRPPGVDVQGQPGNSEGAPPPSDAPGVRSPGQAAVDPGEVPAGDLDAGATTGALGGEETVSREELVKAWGDHVLTSLKGRARARFRAGRFVTPSEGAAVFALPDETHRSYAEECRAEVEQALSAHFATGVRLKLVVDDDSVAPPPVVAEPADDVQDISEMGDPVSGVASIEEKLLQVFPGAQEV